MAAHGGNIAAIFNLIRGVRSGGAIIIVFERVHVGNRAVGTIAGAGHRLLPTTAGR